MDYLCFWLIGPMGAFGGPSGHEFRRTGQMPTRSGVLGLIGACLGVRRSDVNGQEALRAFGVSVALYNVGVGFRDFHTIQTVPSARIKSPKTRANALDALNPSDNAVITRRDYVTDCAYGIAIWRRSDGAPTLKEVDKALQYPVFVPYVGRKSCPVSHPFFPQKLTAGNSIQVFDKLERPENIVIPQKPQLVKTDELGPCDRVDWMMDDPIDRQLWHFERRAAHTTYIKGEQS